MAQRTFLPGSMGLARKPKVLHFRFFPAGAGNPTVAAQDSKGVASIVRNGTAGEWLITLQDNYRRLLSAQATIQMAAATDLVPQFATISTAVNARGATVMTLLLRANAVAIPTDIAADANNSISVSLFLDDADS